MTEPLLPLITEPEELETLRGDESILVVDLSKPATYSQYHIPGAVHLDYAQIIRHAKPVMGLVPDDDHLDRVFSAIGMREDHHVVAYDDEGGGKACRLLWTLDLVRHRRHSLLNGGLYSWANEDHELTPGFTAVPPTEYRISGRNNAVIADHDYILEHLTDAGVRLLDVRTPEEYAGTKRFSARGGHIPGAANMDWTLAMDRGRNLRLLPAAEIEAMLTERGITRDAEIVVYCQTHHRSAYSYIMLRSLGFDRVRGYAGSWSEWGNDPESPIE